MTVGTDDLRFGARAVYFPDEDVASVSDLHVGLAEAARRDGTALPFDEETALEEAVRDVVVRFDPSTLVFDGDVQHSFGGIGDAGETVRRLERVVEESGAEPVFVEGNHDTDLDAVVESHTWHEEGDAVFVHGDTVPANLPDASVYVVGHDHPTVEIEGQKQPCFLHGPYEDASVVMTPSLNPLCEGVVVNEMRARDFMSPFVRDFDPFRVAVETEDDVLRFPPIEEFRRML
jgi:putative SbcD/Mre11-related phosphoesterase